MQRAEWLNEVVLNFPENNPLSTIFVDAIISTGIHLSSDLAQDLTTFNNRHYTMFKLNPEARLEGSVQSPKNFILSTVNHVNIKVYWIVNGRGLSSFSSFAKIQLLFHLLLRHCQTNDFLFVNSLDFARLLILILSSSYRSFNVLAFPYILTDHIISTLVY